MSKEGSQVAFIPDNISNISSAKEKFNEDTSQKIDDSQISKFTKFQNNNFDSQTGLEVVEIKALNQISQKALFKQDTEQKQMMASIAQKIIKQNIHAAYGNTKSQDTSQKKLSIHKHMSDPSQTFSVGQFKRSHQFDTENTYLQGKHTQTDVISEKESFIEEEEDIMNEQNTNEPQANVVHYDNIQANLKMMLKKQQFDPAVDITQEDKEPFYVTEIARFDEFDTEKGWLEHCLVGNAKYLLRQTNLLLSYNNAVMMGIEKVQLRTKIIELQLETNKLKIALRKSQSSKHINFSVDIKLNRPTVLKIPKKVDNDLRTYCTELEKTVNELRNLDKSNEKELSLLEFYQKQFEKKVNYAYIYQEYLIEKAKRQLTSSFNLTLGSNNKFKSPSRVKTNHALLNEGSLTFSKSPKRTQKVLFNSGSSNQTSSNEVSKDLLSQIDESVTSLAHKLKCKHSARNHKTVSQTNLRIRHQHQASQKSPNTKLNQSASRFVRSGFNTEYYTQNLNMTGTNKQMDESITRRIALTHHKDLSLPSHQKHVSIQTNGKGDKPFIPLFNTPNRSKKHFYYECQTYLQQLEKDYLFACQSQKQNILLKNQNGFRQRELLKMKALQMKNQILDTEVDIVAKEKNISKENQILKRELQMLENQLQTKFNHESVQENIKKTNRSMKSPLKLKNLMPDDYNLLYKQAERRLKSYKSNTILQSISRPNIPKSPRKVQTQMNIPQEVESQAKNYKARLLRDNKSQNSDARTLKKDPKYEERKLSKNRSPIVKVKISSKSKSKNFLNRFKTSLSENELNLTIKQADGKTKRVTANPQKTTVTERINHTHTAVNISTPQTEFVEEEYYPV